MNTDDQQELKQLLRQAMPRVDEGAGPRRDLWPEVLKRLNEKPARVPWFDWALVVGVITLVALFPAWIPVLLYYL